MDKVIFLTQRQKGILCDSGVNLNSLFTGDISSVLSRESISTIDSNTYVMLKDNAPLANMGFVNGMDSQNDAPVMAGSPELDQQFIQEARSGIWGAAAPSPGCLVVWIESDEMGIDNSHNMSKLNLLTIVKAMANVMSFKDLKNTRQFELAVIQAA